METFSKFSKLPGIILDQKLSPSLSQRRSFSAPALCTVFFKIKINQMKAEFDLCNFVWPDTKNNNKSTTVCGQPWWEQIQMRWETQSLGQEGQICLHWHSLDTLILARISFCSCFFAEMCPNIVLFLRYAFNSKKRAFSSKASNIEFFAWPWFL